MLTEVKEWSSEEAALSRVSPEAGWEAGGAGSVRLERCKPGPRVQPQVPGGAHC